MRFYPISAEIVSKKAQGSTNVFKNHIIKAVMDVGYSLPYSILSEKLFGKNIGFSFKCEYPETREVIDQIHEANGLAVLAHPKKSDVIDGISDYVDMGLDGIEVWHPSADKESTEELLEIAAEYRLLATGGSDFHGMYSSGVHILGSYTTPDDKIEEMKKRKQEMYKKI